MTEGPREATAATGQNERVERAKDLIGSDRLWSGQLLYAGAQLGVFDLLGDAPTPAIEVASRLDLDPDHTYRFLRVLSHFDVLEETNDRAFTLTELGALYQADHPDSVRPGLLVSRSPEWLRPMLHLVDAIAEGGPTGFERAFGTSFFEYLEGDPEFATAFNDHMTERTVREAGAVLEVLGPDALARFESVCDVAGGHGRLLGRVLQEHPDMEGTVLELESVVEATDRLWPPKLGVDDRCRYVAGDMFESVPTADAYFMKAVLHDWPDARCVELLSNVREAVSADGRLFVVEAVVPGPNESHFAKRLDMTMMLFLGGRERTEAEYAELLAEGGWELVDRHDTEPGPMSVLEARPA